MEDNEKIGIVSQFLLQSPPGEINDVLDGEPFGSLNATDSQLIRTPYFLDVRVLINNDEALMDGIRPVIELYNVEQFISVNAPDVDHQARTRLLPRL